MSECINEQFIKGCHALDAGDAVSARRAFSAVVALDPEAFDGWLGLHALAQHRPGPVLDALVHAAPHAGDLQERTAQSLASAWSPSTHLRLPLLGARDAYLARIAAHLDAGEDEPAEGLLLRIAHPEHIPTSLLWARVHDVRGHWEKALRALALVVNDPHCGPEAERLRGLLLWRAGCTSAAVHHLRLAAERAPSLAARLEARYHEATLCHHLEDYDGERHALELIYAEQPAYGDVAERLFPERADDITWERLVAELERTPSQ